MSSCDAAIRTAPRPAVDSVSGSLSGGSSLNEALKALTSQLRLAVDADDAEDTNFEAVQDLFAALCEFYAGDVTQRGAITPLNTLDGASATAVMMTTSALLRGANLELFELGMWQTWSGMK